MEMATLRAATTAAAALPSGRWLSVNASPGLLVAGAGLGGVLRDADRPIVIEVTEHERVPDYDVLRTAIRGLGTGIRLAVDDAGAGSANFAHIVGLRPDLVKLDLGLVRGIDRDLARQALAVGMHHFARAAGCQILAEGIETPEEAETLAALGVELGQGYLYGRPATVEHWLGEAGLRAMRAADQR
jgi:EAL domain-containing protein (putative c-di-GMP-specific phosphodiesterase class I)